MDQRYLPASLQLSQLDTARGYLIGVAGVETPEGCSTALTAPNSHPYPRLPTWGPIWRVARFDRSLRQHLSLKEQRLKYITYIKAR